LEMQNIIASLVELTAREDCDPNHYDCSGLEPSLHSRHLTSSDYYIFGAVGLFNAMLPAAYYAFSTDYSGEYYKKNPKDDPSRKKIESMGNDGDMLPSSKMELMEIVDGMLPPIQTDDEVDAGEKQTASEKKKKEPRRKRGDFDDNIWRSIAIVHASLWGTSTLMFVLSFLGLFETSFAYFIEHGISNLNFLVYIGTVVGLSMDGAKAGDGQAYFEMALYAMMFGGVAYIMELLNGVGGIKYLRPDYPYDDLVLLPSIFYSMGIFEHRMHMPIRDERENHHGTVTPVDEESDAS